MSLISDETHFKCNDCGEHIPAKYEAAVHVCLACQFARDLNAAMTPKQYADAIDRLGLSQRAAGAFLGVDERTSRRWIAGDAAIPESVAKLLRLMVRLNITPDDVK